MYRLLVFVGYFLCLHTVVIAVLQIQQHFEEQMNYQCNFDTNATGSSIFCYKHSFCPSDSGGWTTRFTAFDFVFIISTYEGCKIFAYKCMFSSMPIQSSFRYHFD